MALTDNLLAFYKLNDLTDSSGNGNTLTNNNGVTFSSGKIGNAADFDGTNSLSKTETFLPIGNSDRTVSLWFKTSYIPPGENGEGAMFNYGSQGSSGIFTIFLFSGGNIGFAGWGNDTNTEIFVSDNNWHNVIVTHSSSTGRKIYLDSVEVGSSANSLDTGTDVGLQIAGFFEIPSETFQGQIDAVGIWNRTLSEAEVTSLYNSGTGLELDGAAPASSSMVKLIDGVKLFGKTKFVS